MIETFWSLGPVILFTITLCVGGLCGCVFISFQMFQEIRKNMRAEKTRITEKMQKPLDELSRM